MGVLSVELRDVKGINVGSTFKMDSDTTYTPLNILHAFVGAHTSTIGGANQEQSNGLPATVKDHTVLSQIHESVTQGTDYRNRDCSVMVLVTDSDHNIPIGSHVKLNNFPIFSSTNESSTSFLQYSDRAQLPPSPGTAFTETLTNCDLNNKSFIVIDHGRIAGFPSLNRTTNDHYTTYNDSERDDAGPSSSDHYDYPHPRDNNVNTPS